VACCAFCGHRLPFGDSDGLANINELCDIVRETAYAVHCYHRNGHLEKIYENALVHRLRKQGIKALQQQPIIVYDEDGTVIGEYFADLFIEDCLIVELKAVRQVADDHVAQILGYLKSTRIETGLLINFGGAKLFVKKYLMTGPTGSQPFDVP
jgi:GxxExxY protein